MRMLRVARGGDPGWSARGRRESASQEVRGGAHRTCWKASRRRSIRRSEDRERESERQDEATHHADKDATLLRDTPDTGIADDADGEACAETGESDREACAELDEAGVERHGGLKATRDEDRHDEAVDLRARSGGEAVRIGVRGGRGAEKERRGRNARQ